MLPKDRKLDEIAEKIAPNCPIPILLNLRIDNLRWERDMFYSDPLRFEIDFESEWVFFEDSVFLNRSYLVDQFIDKQSLSLLLDVVGF